MVSIPAWRGPAALLTLSLLALAPVGLGAPQAPQFVEDDAPVTLEGQKAPTFTMKTLDGKEVSLDKLKGKVVLVDFWASWCGPCRNSVPHLNALNAELKAKGLEIIGVNIDKEEAKARAWLEGLQRKGDAVGYTVALDPRAVVAGKYQVQQMPTAFLIDRKGTVVKRFVGFGDKTKGELDALIKATLAKK